jgi:hypothetical protein
LFLIGNGFTDQLSALGCLQRFIVHGQFHKRINRMPNEISKPFFCKFFRIMK